MKSYIRSRLIIHLRKVLRWIYSFRLRRYPTLHKLLEHFSASRSAAVDLADAIALYEYVVTRKPRCILELGSGTSTNIICQAILDIQKEDRSYKDSKCCKRQCIKWYSIKWYRFWHLKCCEAS